MDSLGLLIVSLIIGAVGALAAIIVPFLVSRLERPKKSISYELLAYTPLITVTHEMKDELQILFHGKPVEDLQLILVKIINNGNVPIIPTDYIQPLSIDFGEIAEIRTAEVTEVEPANLEASFQVNENEIILKPLLLNVGDWIIVKALVSRPFNNPHVSARIVGIKSIRPVVARKFAFLRPFRLGLLLFIYSYGASQISRFLGIALDPVSLSIGIAVSALTGATLFLISDWWASVTRPYIP